MIELTAYQMTLFEYVIILLICMVFHELGHWIPAKLFHAHPKFSIRGTAIIMSSQATRRNGIIISIGGIVAGILPLYFFELTSGELAVLFLLLIMGSWIDFRQIDKSMKNS